MKMVIMGAAFLLAGAIFFLTAFITTGSVLPASGAGVVDKLFWVTLFNTKMFYILIISIITMILGFVVMIWGNIREK